MAAAPRLFGGIDLDNLRPRRNIGEKSDRLRVAGEYQHLIGLRKLSESKGRTPCSIRIKVY